MSEAEKKKAWNNFVEAQKIKYKSFTRVTKQPALMQVSPTTNDFITKSIDRAIGCIEPRYAEVIRNLEIARILVNKAQP